MEKANCQIYRQEVVQQGLTVVAMATDRKSISSSWRHVIKEHGSSPMCRSGSKELMSSSVVGALGTVQILVGVFNIGLGPQRIEAYPFWLGALFITAGIVSILADMFPFPCLVGFSAFVNIVGAILSIVGIVLYAIHVATFTIIWMCANNNNLNSNNNNNNNNCIFLANLAQKLLRGVDITMIVVSVLQLCVSISLAVLGIKSLCYRGRDEVGTNRKLNENSHYDG
ncbi:uncharacterized protein LOC108248880 isoform X2 [Kryptolebias marmoratus]|nr:uncharacterized protein LOC108248880 isoform X2 [Kryptolebias marmoratus]